MTYKFEIIETLRREIEVEAESTTDAYYKVEDACNAEEIVLTAADFSGREINRLL